MNNYKSVDDYYHTKESRFGYPLVLRGAKHFGLYHPGMSKWAFSQALRNMEDALAERLDLSPGSYVLDAGSGMGAVGARLAGKHKLKVQGIDILDFNVEAAKRMADRQGLAHRLEFDVMNYASLDFEEGTFDGVYTMETLVHAPDHKKVLSEFFRVLKPGGVLVNIEYARDEPHNMPLAARKAFSDVNRYSAMPAFDKFTYGVLETDLAATGFQVERVDDETNRMLPMLQAFAMLASAPYALLRRFKDPSSIVNMMSAVEYWRHRRYFKYNIYVSRKPLDGPDE